MRKYYVGLDVHKISIAIAVLNAHGKLITRTVMSARILRADRMQRSIAPSFSATEQSLAADEAIASFSSSLYASA